jgi:uncharacterized protein YqgV (UPF0045/DUF77 family)
MQKTDPLISVQVSVYALDGKPREAVHAYLAALDAAGLERETGSMATVVWGPADAVWDGLRQAYTTVAAAHPVIVNTTLSNAAPLPARAAGQR